MQQTIREAHKIDAAGNPAGGFTDGVGLAVRWQDGPLAMGGERREPNGAFVEDLIKAAHGRLNFYQASRFNCVENQQAIGHLEAALACLESRTLRRERAGTEGTHNGN